MNLDPFLTYMERYNPGFRSRIRGVSEREIAVMEELYQRPLPESYKEFLRMMGADLGGFHLVNDSDSSYDAVMERAKERLEDPIWGHRFHDLVIVAPRYFESEDASLQDAPGGEPRVVGGDPTPYIVFSSSLQNMLMGVACMRYGLREYPHRRPCMGPTRAESSHAAAVLKSQGFEFLWFSDAYLAVAERGEVRLALHQRDGAVGAVTITALDPKELVEVEAVVERELGMSEPYFRQLTGVKG